MTAHDQLCLLSQIAREIKRITDGKNDAIDLRTEAEFAYIDEPSAVNKKLFVKAKALVQKMDAMIKARNRQHSSLQTTIRATPA